MFHWSNWLLYAKLAAVLGPKGAAEWRNAKRNGGVVHTELSSHPLYVRGRTSDADVFSQIFVEQEYRCIDDLEDVRLIVDAGANVGYSSAFFLTRFPEARIIALEPDPDNYETAKRNLSPWGDRVTLLQAALWSAPGTVSLCEGTDGWGRQVSQGDGVRAVTMPSLIEDYGLDSIDLLKVDIEGAEREVFGNAGWLRYVRNMVVELHGSEETRIFHDAIRHRAYRLSTFGELTVCLSGPEPNLDAYIDSRW